jgi:hypothetical protein
MFLGVDKSTTTAVETACADWPHRRCGPTPRRRRRGRRAPSRQAATRDAIIDYISAAKRLPSSRPSTVEPNLFDYPVIYPGQ